MLRDVPYPYLASCLILLQILLVALALDSARRHLAVLSGLLSSPYALLSVFFVPEYWAPVRTTRLAASPEDFIFSFATGGIVWLLASWPLRRRFTHRLDWARFLGRYLECVVPGVTIGWLCFVSGLGVMASAIVGIAAVWGVLLWRCGGLWPLSAAGAFGFALFYAVLMVAAVVVWPDLHLHWNAANLWGPRLLGVPVEEIAWALAYGAVWPLFMAYVLDTRLAADKSIGGEAFHGAS